LFFQPGFCGFCGCVAFVLYHALPI
jgi:hypothetical protein